MAEVSYRNPAGLTETLCSFDQRTGWLDDLSSYVAERAARTLPDGERLLVMITDLQRAATSRCRMRKNLVDDWLRDELAPVARQER